MNMQSPELARPANVLPKRALIGVAVAALLIGACGSTGSRPAAALPSDASGAIQKANERFAMNVKLGDAGAVVSDFYAADAIVLPPGAPEMKGAEAIRQYFAGLLSAGSVNLRLTTETVTEAASGDLAAEVGQYELTITPKTGGPIHDVGKYVVTWRKKGERWQALYDIFNTNAPVQ
jgi:ketosteroid isomerase-like protein